MTRRTVVPVIMSGGAGSRLWPVSRGDKPKQFHSMVGGDTLLGTTLSRVAGDSATVAFEPYIILSSAKHVANVEAHLPPDAPCGALIYEPCVRSTAPAVAVATHHIAQHHPDAAILMLASDAHIADVAAFHQAIAHGVDAADAGGLVTFGIVPDRAETGYGYIRRGAAAGHAFEVQEFVEKPNAPTAQAYLEDGGYYWNAGIFLFKPAEMIAEFHRQCPEIYAQSVAAYERARRDGPGIYLDNDAFAACPTESIDYAVMEHAAQVKVVPVDMGWNDIGSWAQVYDVAKIVAGETAGQADAARINADANVTLGDVIAVNANANYVKADRGLVALVGTNNLAILQTEDATVIIDRDHAQDVKLVVDRLKKQSRPEPGVSASTTRIVRPARGRVGDMRQWLFESALPFWYEAGLDREHGGVVERLNLDGSPKVDDYKRLRVLARQIYVYAHAKLMGFDAAKADAFIDHALTQLLEHGWHADGGWIHLFTREGTVKDDTRDAYDQAFVIFGLAWAYRATGRPDLLDWIDKTLSFIDAELADPVHGGLREGVPATQPRRANPHMHFLEAMLAAHAATRGEGADSRYIDRAAGIVALLDNKLLDHDTWTLTEFFTDDWQILPGDAGQIAEPGHHYEWVWLLGRYSAHSGADVSQMQRKLFATAEAFGRNHATHRVYDEVSKSGHPIKTSSRSWPQTEALKCLLALHEAGHPGLERRIDETLAVLMDDFFAVTPAGGWMDQFADDGTPMADTMPASTFYHAFSAGAELLRVFDDGSIPAI